MKARTIKWWFQVHKWTSLVCTAFLLMLCLTGLPLIFYHEIEHALGNEIELPEIAAGTTSVSIDKVVEAGKRKLPGHVPMFVNWDEDEPGKVFLSMAKAPDAPRADNLVYIADGRTGEILGEWLFRDTVMYFLLRLHYDMFAGVPGALFLGFMGLLFVVAVVSGIILYAPFMRRLNFGTVRYGKSTRLKWLDLHNLLGVVTIAWVLVVGLTGVINTLTDPIFKLWQQDQLAEMVGPYKNEQIPNKLASLEEAIQVARKAVPGMTPDFVAFPGSDFSSRRHYGIFMRGETPLTSKLLKPVLVDAKSGELTATRDLPWYVTALLISQPLHFGNYGGMPLKIIWAILDIVTIIILGSGLYLWIARRKVPIDTRLAELNQKPDITTVTGAAE